jgi:hypothetical protein
LTLKKKNPLWEIRYGDTQQRHDFMEKHFKDTSVLWAFKMINPAIGVSQSDLWRYQPCHFHRHIKNSWLLIIFSWCYTVLLCCHYCAVCYTGLVSLLLSIWVGHYLQFNNNNIHAPFRSICLL